MFGLLVLEVLLGVWGAYFPAPRHYNTTQLRTIVSTYE